VARESILVVEDDKIIAMELRGRLQQWGFVVPATAATGEDACALALRHKPDLVLMDIWLNGPMDGIQAAERIHATDDIPIIYVTANADEITLDRAKRTQPYGYVLKPFEELELRTTIEIALTQHRFESRLKESEQRFSTTLTSIGDAVIATDDRRAVTFINPVACALLGIARDDALGKDIEGLFRIIDEQTRQPRVQPVREALASGSIRRPEWPAVLVDSANTERPIYYNVAPIRNAKGQTQGAVLVFRDIAERRRAERLQSALYQISEAANSSHNLDDLFALVHRVIADLLPAKNFYIALTDEAFRTITFPYFVDESDSGSVNRPFGPRPFGNGITEFVIRNGVPLLLSRETFTHLEHLGEIEGNGAPSECWMGVPLRASGGQAIGALAVQSYAPGTCYNARDKDVLEFVSLQVARAIERRSAEQVLRDSEERFRTIFARSAIGIGITDVRTLRLTATNAALQEMLGYTAGELLAMTVNDITHPDDLEFDLQENNALLAGAIDHYVSEKRYIRKDGGIVWGRITVSLVRDEQGTPRFGIGLVEDITKRNRDEEKIREQAALLDHAQDAILVRDLESTVTYWNKGAERLYGWSRQEACGRNEFELLCRAATPEIGKAQKKVLQTGEWVGEMTQVTNAGEEVVVQSRWTLVRDHAGEPEAILVINTNMTDRKKLEAQFLRAQRLESIGTLAGGIAHDLNNVLSPILLAAHLLRSRTTDPAMRKWVDTIESSAQRGAGILSQVLTFARGAAGTKATIQPRHLLKEMAKITLETFPRSIETVLDIQKDLWTITGDATQLHQVLMNLCVNARDAMPGGGTLTLSAENRFLKEEEARQFIDAAPGPYIIVSVCDTGTGIPAANLEKIFEPFFTTKEPGRGTGLGLSTTHAIVRGHKGFIRVSSSVSQGTEFRIFLPAHGSAEPLSPGEEAEAHLAGDGETILVVDDERTILTMTEEMLTSYGYRAITAIHGKEAVALYARDGQTIDAVIVDMMMPQMDGAATIQALRRMNPEVRILSMSGIPAEDGKAGERSLVRHFIAKPFTATALLKALREILEGDHSTPPADSASQETEAA
jgi:PAS domain S-box-containing protein